MEYCTFFLFSYFQTNARCERSNPRDFSETGIRYLECHLNRIAYQISPYELRYFIFSFPARQTAPNPRSEPLAIGNFRIDHLVLQHSQLKQVETQSLRKPCLDSSRLSIVKFCGPTDSIPEYSSTTLMGSIYVVDKQY